MIMSEFGEEKRINMAATLAKLEERLNQFINHQDEKMDEQENNAKILATQIEWLSNKLSAIEQQLAGWSTTKKMLLLALGSVGYKVLELTLNYIVEYLRLQ